MIPSQESALLGEATAEAPWRSSQERKDNCMGDPRTTRRRMLAFALQLPGAYEDDP
jgi:hypothetical protein